MKAGSCPVEKTVVLLGDSCSMLIIRDLLVGPKRFSEFERSLSVSTRTLAKKLKTLEREKLVSKRESQGQPACGRYELTKKGLALKGIMDAVRTYGEAYL